MFAVCLMSNSLELQNNTVFAVSTLQIWIKCSMPSAYIVFEEQITLDPLVKPYFHMAL